MRRKAARAVMFFKARRMALGQSMSCGWKSNPDVVLDTDIFIPKLRLSGNKIAHQLNAGRVIQNR